MTAGAFAEKKFIEIKGRRMAYIDEGDGAPIVFQHGNPTSSYLWRKVMPACKGLGRLIACDLIGMGDSDKLPQSGPDRYTFVEQRDFLFALWEELGIKRDVILVIHDWRGGARLSLGSATPRPGPGHRLYGGDREASGLGGIPGVARDLFKAFRTPAGEDMILRDNLFLEGLFFVGEKENLTEADKEEYRRPFLNAGEDRRAMLTWPRQIPLDGEPPGVVKIVGEYSEWLRTSDAPKLWLKGDPGAMVSGSVADYCATFPNQTSLTVKGVHSLQESSGPEIGAAVADFVRNLRK
jgi:haloalkane dehalogenase